MDELTLQKRYDGVVLTLAQLVERYGTAHLPQGTTDGLAPFDLLTALATTLSDMHNRIAQLDLAVQAAQLDREEALDGMYKLAIQSQELLKDSKITPR